METKKSVSKITPLKSAPISKDKLKEIVNKIDSNKKTYDDLAKKDQEKEKEMNDLKEQVTKWMNKANTKIISVDHKLVKTFQSSKIERTTISDLLQIIQKEYGDEVTHKIFEEMELIHAKKFDGEFEIRFLKIKDESESNETEPTKKRNKNKFKLHPVSKKQKIDLVL